MQYESWKLIFCNVPMDKFFYILLNHYFCSQYE